MKKLFVLFFFLLTLAINAQDVKYELYKCSGTQFRELEPKVTEWISQDADFIIRIVGSTFEFNNEAKTIFYINESLGKRSGFDKDNDKFTRTEWSGYDQNGLKCHLVSIDYTNLTNRNFILEYKDVEILFQCNIINTPVNSTTVNPTRL